MKTPDRTVTILALASLFCAGAALAKPDGPPAQPKFLTDAEADVGLALAPPPAEGSPRARLELAELRRLQRRRTDEDRSQFAWDDRHKDGQALIAALGPGYDLKLLPQTAALLEDVRHDEKIVVRRAKSHFQRRRPWMVDRSLQPCLGHKDQEDSYPSGHAAMAFSVATVLAAAVPARRQALYARAQAYARERVVCAHHFPSDIAAGKTLGDQIGQELLAKPSFQAELRAASRELRSTTFRS